MNVNCLNILGKSKDRRSAELAIAVDAFFGVESGNVLSDFLFSGKLRVVSSDSVSVGLSKEDGVQMKASPSLLSVKFVALVDAVNESVKTVAANTSKA